MLTGSSGSVTVNDVHRLVVTVLVSAASSAVVCVLLAPAPLAPAARAEIDWSRVDRIDARLQAMERIPPAVQGSLATPSASPTDRVEAPPPDPWPAAAARLAAMEARLFRLELVAAVPAEQAQAPVPEFPTREDAGRSILDPTSDVAKKMRAHEALRKVNDAYTPAMVAELLRIGTTNQDGGVRADVWRFFDGESSVPAIVNPLVRALQADPDARAREEAAETLGNYFDDPIVESALQLAVESDGSERVRNKAKRTLAARRSIAPPAEPR